MKIGPLNEAALTAATSPVRSARAPGPSTAAAETGGVPVSGWAGVMRDSRV